MNTIALERLRAFRQHIYTTFGCRRDAHAMRNEMGARDRRLRRLAGLC